MKESNPKDALAVDKVPLELIPPAAAIELVSALRNGAKKYGAWNWRQTGVRPEVYLGAALRHLLRWQSGEEIDSDSGVHHLGHVMACAAIVLDAMQHGKLEPWTLPLRDGSEAERLR